MLLRNLEALMHLNIPSILRHKKIPWGVAIAAALLCSFFVWMLLSSSKNATWNVFGGGEKELLVVYDALPTIVDPYSLTLQKRQVSSNIFEGLTQIDRLYRPKPSLALSWGSVDALTWEFKLRKGVKFHNGAEFTAQDVISSFQRAKTSKEPELRLLLANITDVKAVDAYIVHITTKAPDPLLLTKLSFLLVTSGKDATGEEYFTGTGPYKIRSHEEKNGFVLEKNDAYWGEKPSVTVVNLQAVADKQVRFNELLKGTIDILASVPPSKENIATLKQSQILDLLSIPSLELVYLMFNQEENIAGTYNPFSDSIVRKAVSLAINQEQIVSFGEGFASPVNQYIASGILGYNPDIPEQKHALEEAKALLGERRFTMKLFTTKDFKIIAEYLRVQMEPLGVNVDYSLLSEEEFLSKLKKHEMQSYILGWRFDLGDSLEFFKTHMHTPGDLYGQYNASGYANGQVDQLIAQAEKELNETSRLSLLQQIQKIIQKDLVGVPLFETQHLFAKKKSIEWEPRLDGLILFKEIH